MSEAVEYIQEQIGDPSNGGNNSIIRETTQIQRMCAVTIVQTYDIVFIKVDANEVTVRYNYHDEQSEVIFITSSESDAHKLQKIFMYDIRDQIMTFLNETEDFNILRKVFKTINKLQK